MLLRRPARTERSGSDSREPRPSRRANHWKIRAEQARKAAARGVSTRLLDLVELRAQVADRCAAHGRAGVPGREYIRDLLGELVLFAWTPRRSIREGRAQLSRPGEVLFSPRCVDLGEDGQMQVLVGELRPELGGGRA